MTDMQRFMFLQLLTFTYLVTLLGLSGGFKGIRDRDLGCATIILLVGGVIFLGISTWILWIALFGPWGVLLIPATIIGLAITD